MVTHSVLRPGCRAVYSYTFLLSALCPPPLPAPSDEPIQANFSTSTPTVVVSKAGTRHVYPPLSKC